MAQNITLCGASYSDVPSIELPKTGGGSASFSDVSDTTAIASNVLKNKKFYLASGAAATGSMTNRGAVTATIDTPGGTYTVPKGYHNGNGTVTATYSGYNVATGTYTGTTSTHSFTISGLSFTPIGVMITAMANIGTNMQRCMLSTTNVTAVSPTSGSDLYGFCAVLSKSNNVTTASFVSNTGNPITLNSDGFTVSRTNDFYSGLYSYVCWG